MFERQRPDGFWTFNSVVEDFEFEYIDESLSNALDGKEAGAYSIENDMVIGGADPLIEWRFETIVRCNEGLFVNGGFYAYGDAQIGIGSGDDLTIAATTEFDAEATFNDAATFIAAAQFNADVVVGNAAGDDFTVNATSVFEGQVTFEDNVYMNDALVMAGDLHFEGGAIVTPVGFADAGKLLFRSKTISSPGNQSVRPAEFDTVYVPSGIVDDGDEIDIDDTGAENGMRITFVTRDTVNAFSVTGMADAFSYPMKNAAGSYRSVTFERIGGVWIGIIPAERDS